MGFYHPREVYDAWVYAFADYANELVAKGIAVPTPPMWENVIPSERKVYESMTNLLNLQLDEALLPIFEAIVERNPEPKKEGQEHESQPDENRRIG